MRIAVKRARVPKPGEPAQTGHVRLHGKGDEVCTVPLPPVARQHLAAWLDERGTHDGPLWTGQRGVLTISGIVQALLGQASIETAARYFRAGTAEQAAVVDRTFE
jgi:hypothetical protein